MENGLPDGSIVNRRRPSGSLPNVFMTRSAKLCSHFSPPEPRRGNARGFLAALVAVFGLPLQPCGAADACRVDATDLDIEIDVRRVGYYRQNSSGAVPEARADDFGKPGETAAFWLRVSEYGLEGFRFPHVSFEGTVSFAWGSIAVEEQALNWSGVSQAFAQEEALAAATPPGGVSFRFQDEQGSFSSTLNSPAWTGPVPALSNFAEAQAIDHTKPFTLRWSSLGQRSGIDFVVLRVFDEDPTAGSFHSPILSTIPCSLAQPFPGSVYLAGNANSFVLPAQLLSKTTANYFIELSALRFNGHREGQSGLAWDMTLVDEKTTIIPIRRAGGPVGSVAPSIVSQPLDLVRTNGSLATFTVSATGTPAPTYQWLREGMPVEGGASSTLVIPVVSPALAGTYRVSVSNSAGSILSDPAVLTVVAPTTTVTAQLGIEKANGSLVVSARSSTSGLLILEASNDLLVWSPWQTNQIVSGVETRVSAGSDSDSQRRYFRARR